MNLSDEQKKKLASWLNDGKSLADIQKLLKEEFGMGLTYMEARFLVDDLGLELKKEVEATPEENSESTEGTPTEEGAPAELVGGVGVSVDPVTRPGAIVSGEVTFSDGEQATWQLDQMGRIGLSPKTEGYKPGAEDVQEFQKVLQEELQKSGF